MNGYILSILGIVICGVIIDIIIPSGSISKYIKSIYSIFVVGVLLSPVLSLISKTGDYKLVYSQYDIDAELYEYIATQRTNSTEQSIKTKLKNDGFNGVDININFSIKNNNLIYNSCEINLENLVIDQDKQHINKYEFITKVVKEHTNLNSEEIIFQWVKKKES